MKLLFHENMSGGYHLLAHPLEDCTAELSLDVSIDRLRDFVRTPALHVEGVVSLAGVATARPCSGKIALRVVNEQRIPYDLHFTADDGRAYQLYGQRDLTVPKLADALTTLPMSLCDDTGREVGRAVLRFDMRTELVQLLRSIRVRVW
jgi:hypothetical protein